MTGSAVMDRAVARNRAKTSGSARLRGQGPGAPAAASNPRANGYHAHDAHFETNISLPPDGRDRLRCPRPGETGRWRGWRWPRARRRWGPGRETATRQPPAPGCPRPSVPGGSRPGVRPGPRADAAVPPTHRARAPPATGFRRREASASGCARSCVPLSLLFDWRRTPLRKCAPVKQSTKGAPEPSTRGHAPPCARLEPASTGRVATPPV